MQVDDSRKQNIRRVGSIEPVRDFHQYLGVGLGRIVKSGSINQEERSKIGLVTSVKVYLIRACDNSAQPQPISGQDETALTRHQSPSDLSSSLITEIVDKGALPHPSNPHDTDDDIVGPTSR